MRRDEPAGDDGVTGSEAPRVPVGIEELITLAAVNEDFAATLLAERSRAIAASGVSLTHTERGILSATDDGVLRQMIRCADRALPDEDRRAFMGRSAAAVMALLGISATAACTRVASGTGARPDRPHPKPAPSKGPDAGARADQSAGAPVKIIRHPGETTGIRPDRP